MNKYDVFALVIVSITVVAAVIVWKTGSVSEAIAMYVAVINAVIGYLTGKASESKACSERMMDLLVRLERVFSSKDDNDK